MTAADGPRGRRRLLLDCKNGEFVIAVEQPDAYSPPRLLLDCDNGEFVLHEPRPSPDGVLPLPAGDLPEAEEKVAQMAAVIGDLTPGGRRD